LRELEPSVDERVRNLLYRRPELYELVYPEPNAETAAMCRRMFQRYLDRFPSSVLDVGCGTGRDLAGLCPDCSDLVGVDALAEMIAYARSLRPQIVFQVGDMRTFRLGRSFDAVLCMGSALMYALTNADIDATLETFAAHSHPGTLLILDLNNAAGYLPGGCFKSEAETELTLPQFTASARAAYRFDRRRQLLVRTRTWQIPDQAAIHDYCEYRLFFPAELDGLLESKGFRTAGLFDNLELRESDLSGPRLYVASLFRP